MPFDPGREWRLLLAAFQFLTRLPVPPPRFEPDWLPRSAKYFPLVGLAVGGMSTAILFAAARIWPAPIPAILAVGTAVLATGALHEDGLADTADGFGGRTREARLAIMKDPRLGSWGVLALVGAVSLQIAALAALPTWSAATALLAAHAGGRLSAVVLMRLSGYAGDPNAAKVVHAPDRPRVGELVLAALLGLLPLLAMTPLAAGVAFTVATVVAAGFAHRVCRGLGGYTGDVLGATIAVFATAFLLGAAACPGQR